MSKKNKGGLVYSTNPDFKPDTGHDDDDESSVSPGSENLKVFLYREDRGY
jgi:translation initiation factor 1